jgi:hypothetical protein
MSLLWRNQEMANPKVKPYPKRLKELMIETSSILSKAHALADMGMAEIALRLWAAAAAHEECIAPLLDALGRDLEAAVHRISAASCYQKAGELRRAANLFRAALAGPLRQSTRQEVQQMLSDCLAQLTGSSTESGAARRTRQAAAEV